MLYFVKPVSTEDYRSSQGAIRATHSARNACCLGMTTCLFFVAFEKLHLFSKVFT